MQLSTKKERAYAKAVLSYLYFYKFGKRLLTPPKKCVGKNQEAWIRGVLEAHRYYVK